ncbi:hypothetical protein A2631_02130 [Candidatus Daviesbacteria bacterium RIFCSPHIGHO2_01_FULL_44_29]|uniref:UDP-N-acetylglucosamine kinase n=1 Tax=Candidatus Daviesbacteria bacterium RIFCSPHIGHO2_02_FULL_43_12 TaxID=1797776 RepID=A0A1F5KK79_9BACT|nr:MAG: hypothetical protein A2631_02130 [Candidatus Daviesbacteria bacterium RIFCSPHIGHO2_01_FULL_44_29]OGE39529.1 MAG: hypothetical protein A3E86_01770 [Candidatus Daviesbacteria bacterium RIFCSPHIGHO2_12_FULL_47_45]OGE41195.1 MAG: hypothetical protein A3D25_01525 [Candidatus Daviesbacteria bacterium RIFCSPHIGHO2_02_FULL_43_12]OGE69394.1 MAG: hypothetical protein A3B55_03265 [Candidatus Daviesbacteria bacterium RIFCSPLOWO2_01_FULL_43_15]
MINTLKYKFTNKGSVLFIAGAPLSGKSTITSLLAQQIEDSCIQHMDIIRLISQQIESLKPRSARNELVYLGSTDAYKKIGTGEYSKENLIAGYRLYSDGVVQHFLPILDKLNDQDVSTLIIEGVQILPSLIEKYTNLQNFYYVLITASPDGYKIHLDKLFKSLYLKNKYSVSKLIAIQEYLIKEVELLPESKKTIIKNEKDLGFVVSAILQKLKDRNFIEDILL